MGGSVCPTERRVTRVCCRTVYFAGGYPTRSSVCGSRRMLPLPLKKVLSEHDLINEGAFVGDTFYSFDCTWRIVDNKLCLFILGAFESNGRVRTVCVGVRNPPQGYVFVWDEASRFNPMPLTQASARHGTYRFFTMWKGAVACKRLEDSIVDKVSDVNAPRREWETKLDVTVQNKFVLTSNCMVQYHSMRSPKLRRIHAELYEKGCVYWTAAVSTINPDAMSSFVRICPPHLSLGNVGPYVERIHHDLFRSSVCGGRRLKQWCSDTLLGAKQLFRCCAYREIHSLDDLVVISDMAPIPLPTAVYDLEVAIPREYVHSASCPCALIKGLSRDAHGFPTPKPVSCVCTPTVVEAFPNYENAVLTVASRLMNGNACLDVSFAVDPRNKTDSPSIHWQTHGDNLRYLDVRVNNEKQMLDLWDEMLRACGIVCHSGCVSRCCVVWFPNLICRYNILNFDLPFLARRYAILSKDGVRLHEMCQHQQPLSKCDECKAECKHGNILGECSLCDVPADEKGWTLYVPFAFGSCCKLDEKATVRMKKTSTYTAASGTVVKVDCSVFGIVFADMLPIISSQTDTAQKQGDNSLNSAARHLLKQPGKFTLPYSKINDAYLQAITESPDKSSRLYHYCMVDTILAAQLYKMFQVSTQLCCTGQLVGQLPSTVAVRANMNKFASAISLYVARNAEKAKEGGYVRPVVGRFVNDQPKSAYEGVVLNGWLLCAPYTF